MLLIENVMYGAFSCEAGVISESIRGLPSTMSYIVWNIAIGSWIYLHNFASESSHRAEDNSIIGKWLWLHNNLAPLSSKARAKNPLIRLTRSFNLWFLYMRKNLNRGLNRFRNQNNYFLVSVSIKKAITSAKKTILRIIELIKNWSENLSSRRCSFSFSRHRP